MPPLYFDAHRVELIDVPEEVSVVRNQQRLKPLAQLLVTGEFPYTDGDFPMPRHNQWQREHIEHVGSLVARELAELSPPADFGVKAARRLQILGLFPSRDLVEKTYGSWYEFKQTIEVGCNAQRNDIYRNKEYDQLSRTELLDMLIKNYGSVHETSSREKFVGPFKRGIIVELNRMDLAPGVDYLLKRFGSIGIMNEYLGFPDIASWDEHDYITFGASVLRHNGRNSITKSNIRTLSANNLGPHDESIKARFDWEKFKKLSLQEVERQLAEEEKHRLSVEEYYGLHVSPEASSIKFAEKAQHRALYLIGSYYLKGKTPELPNRLVEGSVQKVMNYLLERTRGLTIADIETTAVSMDIFDDLWPTSFPERLPIIAKCRRK
jgi:hypothetical protein